MLVDSTNRVYFGAWHNGSPYWTWKEGTGLSTIIPSGLINNPGLTSSNMANDRVFFGSSTNFYTYQLSTGLSTIITAQSNPGFDHNVPAADDWTTGQFATPSGRVFFGEANTSGSYWTWHSSTGLSTIVSVASRPGQYVRSAADDNDRAYFGDEAGKFWTWHTTTGLSTLVESTTGNPGDDSTKAITGRVFFGEWSTTGTQVMRTWKAPTNCSSMPY